MRSKIVSQRQEEDVPEIWSGVFEGKTDGTPIGILFHNTDQRSQDYGDIKDKYRPGHADFTFDAKYGFRDYRGGGRSSARETVCRVAAAAIAKKLLAQQGIRVLEIRNSKPLGHGKSRLAVRRGHAHQFDAGNLGELLECKKTEAPGAERADPYPFRFHRLASVWSPCRERQWGQVPMWGFVKR